MASICRILLEKSRKIWVWYTDPEQTFIVNDPGKLEGKRCLTVFGCIWNRQKKKFIVKRNKYQQGGLGDVKNQSCT